MEKNLIKVKRKMKIGFVLPCDFHNYEPCRNQPLNAFYLLTILEKEFGDSIEVSIIDLRCVEKNNATYYVPEKDLYLYSVATIDYPETVRIVKEIRNVYPAARHVAGGIHINIYPEQSMEVFDAIALGGGENTILEIVKDASASSLKSLYREGKLLDINAYPFPDRKYLPKSAIVETGLLNGVYYDLPATNVLFSRGCPFKCDFCANLTQSAPQFRAPELIIEEIEYLKREYGLKGLVIKDDSIISPNSDVARRTFMAIKQTGVKWRGNCRANDIPADIIELAKESGCIDLAVGIESISQSALNNINKKLNLEKAKEFLRILKKFDIGIRLNLIIGLPGEPKDIVKKTIDFIKEVGPSSVLLSVLTPVPGSKIFHHPEQFGIKFDQNTPFDKLFSLFGRFDENERLDMVFEYEKITPFGESMTNEEIINNYNEIQLFLRESKLTF
jgi:anaerobic magnesium-protoporphyrin IX monomethyl ester cyclase